MRVAVALLLVIMLASTATGLEIESANAQQARTVPFYAHALPSGGLVLNASKAWSGVQFRSLRAGVNFTLAPAVGSDITILGSLSIRIYARSDVFTLGNIVVALTEMRSDGSTREVVPRISTPQGLDLRIIQLPFLLSRANTTISKGSTLILEAKFTGGSEKANPQIVFDDPRFPTGILLPTLNSIDVKVDIARDGVVVDPALFKVDSLNARVEMQVQLNITEPFGRYHVGNYTATLVETRTGRQIPVSLGLTSQTTYSLALSHDLTLGKGRYSLQVRGSDKSGNEFRVEEPIWVSVFHSLLLRVLDTLQRPVENATVTLRLAVTSWSAQTNSTGWATYTVPSSDIVGAYQVAVSWSGLSIDVSNDLRVEESGTVSVIFPIFDYGITVRMYFLPLPGAAVELLHDSIQVASGTTTVDGGFVFERIPQGVYTLRIRYLGTAYEVGVIVNENKSQLVIVPVPYTDEISLAIFLVAAASVTTAIVRRRTKVYPASFGYFNELTSGGLPHACLVIILGNTGSGKTVLAQTLAHKSLLAKKSCIYVATNEFPNHVRESMRTLGIPIDDYERDNKFVFIDCYSGFAGERSTEKYHVTAPTDLTTLGVRISACLDEMEDETDVYLDSLVPLLTSLKVEYVIGFVQTMGAKVKAKNGKFVSTLGTSVEKSSIVKVEETSDCVIETQLVEARMGQRRRLRIKKLRGKGYQDRWTPFTVESEKGITFFAPKPFNEHRAD